MSITYTVCPNCGQKALPVATRCPGCGLAFEARFYQHSATTPKPVRVSPGLLVAGVVALVLVASAVKQLIKTIPPQAAPVAAVVPAAPPKPEPQPRRDSAAAATESLSAAPSPSLESQDESLPPRSDPVPLAPSVRVVRDSAGTGDGERRYASTWMNVRAGRSGSATVIRVLRPGEVVQVDSLREGWYRLVSSQEPAGYVDRRLLDTSPPVASP